MSGQGAKKTALADEQRQAAWLQVADRDGFTATELATATGMSPEWARKVIREWQAEGLIAEAGQEGQTTVWKASAPPTDDQSVYARESRRPEFAMWRTMRTLRRFAAADVHLTANTDATPLTVADIQKYCSTLAEAGYLAVASKGRPGHRAAVYTIKGRPGPFPPRLVRVPAIYDPNEGSFRVLERRVRP
ncbi:helix-turn-helix domain-containing protein [Paracoccus sanguinis]|uniref:Uncharacterized protein n=1 Tax=Paracoccus sanguinis TaxID=1545044 RepID=A0A1H3BRI1_9RHOB|nr:helix-turn-helix domain-containing protein [Paracoccus sanguinis]SDX43964.1 hypothetical protein SAMN05444276_106114 [Paracoccus sanguinis]